jgi:predicted unusual protein kinase regulating ubiquinone biosynthesis (AarF/ABC1/UbiB family)
MKVGQALSAMEAALPEELAAPYRDALVRLQEAAPPMPTAVVHRVLDESFPAGWRHLFTAFEDRPGGRSRHRQCTGRSGDGPDGGGQR